MLSEELQAASFRGVPFLVPKDEAEEGPKSISHEYPDRRMRYVEDNGLITPKFQVTAVLHGQNLSGQLNALRHALNQPAPGTLQHPYFGAQYCAVLGPYKIVRDETQSGIITLDINFEVTGPPQSVLSSIASPALLPPVAGLALDALYRNFVSKWRAPDSAFSRQIVIAGIERAADLMVAEFSQSAGVLAGARLIWSRAVSLAGQPDRLGRALTGLVQAAIDDEAVQPADLFRGFARLAALWAVPEGGAVPDRITLDYRTRAEALRVLTETQRALLLVALMQAAGGKPYVTAAEVQADEQVIERRFEETAAFDLPADVRAAVMDVYVALMEYLGALSIRLPRVAEMNVVDMPASVLAYQLYEDDGRRGRIVDLNGRQSPVLMNGRVRVLIGGQG